MNENNDVFTMEDEPIASVVQDMRKGSKWLSAFLESYRPLLDGERYLTDGEVAELLRVSRRKMCIRDRYSSIAGSFSFHFSEDENFTTSPSQPSVAIWSCQNASDVKRRFSQ